MRVMITGGAGHIGRAIAAHLLQKGYEVHVIDLVPETSVPHTTYAACDVTNFAAVCQQVRGCDAVVHMAAIPTPIHGTVDEVFRVNTVGTFNVFEAASREGIRRVVQASSINAIGCAWNSTDFRPHYFPIDEDHPLYTSDPYSFSKQQSEEIGAYFWRRSGISSIGLRFPGVYLAEKYLTPNHASQFEAMRQFLDAFQAIPQDEQQRQLASVRERALTFRAQLGIEYPAKGWPVTDSVEWDDLLWRAYMIDRFNLWVSLDVRDAARAVELSLSANYEGSHPLFVNNPYNWLDYPSEALVRLFFPDVTERRSPLEGSQAHVSNARARELIGFEPLYPFPSHGD